MKRLALLLSLLLMLGIAIGPSAQILPDRPLPDTGTGGGGSGHTIKDEGVTVTAHPNLNFTGAGVTCTPNAGTDAIDCTISGAGQAYATVQEEGSALTQRGIFNVIGAALTAADDAANNRTNVTLSQSPASTSVVGTGRTVTIAGTANQVISSAGAQDLTADRTWTLSLPQSIATTSAPQFGRLGLNVAAPATSGQYSAVGGANNITLTTLQRNTDTTPTGNFESFLNAGGTPLWTVDITGSLTAGGIPAARITGNIPVTNLNSGTNASSSTVWCGNGTWCSPTISLGYTAEDVANKSVGSALGASDVLYPSQKAVRDYVTLTAKKVTNTRLQKRKLTQADASPITINADDYDYIRIDELSQSTTFNAPVGTPDDGDTLTISIYTTTARTLTFSTAANAFSAEQGLALPTQSRAGAYVLYAFQWSSVSSKWALVASTQTTTTGTAGQCLVSNGAGAEPTWQTCPGGSGGGTGTINLPVSGVNLPTTNAATIDNAENNTRLLFDASTSECALWQFRVPADFSSAPVFKMLYSMTSATSGGVSIDVSVMATTPGDAADINTDSYGTVNNCDDAAVPSTAGFLDSVSCSLPNADSVAAGDLVKIKLCRATADAADTATGDMEVVGASLEYTK